MGICKMSLCLGGKGCMIAVILLLAGVSIVPDLGANGTFNNTIYVDDDNIGGHGMEQLRIHINIFRMVLTLQVTMIRSMFIVESIMKT